MVHQVVVYLLSVSALNPWFKLVEKVVETLIQLWMVITVLQSSNLIDLTIKLNFRHKVDDPPPLEWEPSSLPAWGPLLYKS